MGSGKTGVGTLLGQNLGLPFVDLDQEISNLEGRDIPEIFKTSGEIYFRKRETEVLGDLLRSGNDQVLAVGGGTPCYGKNLEIMHGGKGAVLIYLKTSLGELRNRLFRERHTRPLISHLETEEVLEDFIRKHLFERTYYYNQADVIVDTTGKSQEEVSREILSGLD